MICLESIKLIALSVIKPLNVGPVLRELRLLIGLVMLDIFLALNSIQQGYCFLSQFLLLLSLLILLFICSLA